MAKTDTSRRSPPWSHGPGRSDRRDGDPRVTAEIAETAEMGTEPGERVGRVRGTEARCALGLLGVFLGGLCGLRGESVPSLAAEPGELKSGLRCPAGTRFTTRRSIDTRHRGTPRRR